MNRLILKPTVYITVGKYRDCIIETFYRNTHVIPKPLTQFIVKYQKMYIKDILKIYKNSEYFDICKEYISFLIKNELIINFSYISEFGKISLEYCEDRQFKGGIIYIDFDPLATDLDIMYHKIEQIGLKFIEFRLLNYGNPKLFMTFLQKFLDISINFIHIVDLNDNLNENDCNEIFLSSIKVLKITQFLQVKDENIHFMVNNRMCHVSKKLGNYKDNQYDLLINDHNANLEFLTVTLAKNPYFFQKIFINQYGRFMESEFLEDNSLSPEMSVAKRSVHELITKSKIEKCKDCELRDICLDRRVPIFDGLNYYYTTECGYDLKTGVWN